MDEIYHNETPFFTEWVIDRGYLHEPFVVIDVGVQGGPHVRWQCLGSCARIYGFDPISEVIESLDKSKAPNQSYRAMALGNEDGERQFIVPANTYEGSFYRSSMDTGSQGTIALGPRTVEIRRLDSLFAAGEIPPADHVKLDCEGFEPEVIRGARNYLSSSNILCVTTETNFGVSPVYLRTPFVDICEMLSEHRLLVFDLAADRRPRLSYVVARARRPWPKLDIMKEPPPPQIGQLGTFDFLFCRDFVAEAASPHHFVTLPTASLSPTVDKLIKSMINFELHGLMDCAVDLAQYYRAQLSQRIDVDESIERLIYRPVHARQGVDIVECLGMIRDLRLHLAEARLHVAEAHARITQLERTLNTTKFFVGRRLATAPARLWRRYIGSP
jgi:FkbM family methyltransferase